jgi:predicted short-subunit dehydrogenase-like oxidoreductase (DUF2520 family)
VARDVRHARRAAKLIDTQTHALASTHLEELPRSDILFITTPDDSVSEVATEIASTTECLRQAEDFEDEQDNAGRTALHASGALSSAALESLSEAGFATGSMHPLVSVSDAIHGAESLGSAFFCLEGEALALRVARRLVRDLGAQSFSINAQDKALYHAAAVMASGHMTALFDIAMEMLAHCNLAPRRARAVLLPLLKSTLENLYTSDPARALTGTFARADTETVKRHLTALHSSGLTDALAAYQLLGRRSLQLAKTSGARPDALKEIERSLKSGEA